MASASSSSCTARMGPTIICSPRSPVLSSSPFLLTEAWFSSRADYSAGTNRQLPSREGVEHDIAGQDFSAVAVAISRLGPWAPDRLGGDRPRTFDTGFVSATFLGGCRPPLVFDC